MTGYLVSPAYMSLPGIAQRQAVLKRELKLASVIGAARADDREVQQTVTRWREELDITCFGGPILGRYSDELFVLGALYVYYRPTFIFDLRRHMGRIPQTLVELSLVTCQTFRDVVCLVNEEDDALPNRIGMYGDIVNSVPELTVTLRENREIAATIARTER